MAQHPTEQEVKDLAKKSVEGEESKYAYIHVQFVKLSALVYELMEMAEHGTGNTLWVLYIAPDKAFLST